MWALGRVMRNGPVARHERGDAARIEWCRLNTIMRFNDLRWFEEARRIELRAAARRFRLHAGLPIGGGLEHAEKYVVSTKRRRKGER